MTFLFLCLALWCLVAQQHYHSYHNECPNCPSQRAAWPCLYHTALILLQHQLPYANGKSYYYTKDDAYHQCPMHL